MTTKKIRVVCLICGKETYEETFYKHMNVTGHISRIEKTYYGYLKHRYDFGIR